MTSHELIKLIEDTTGYGVQSCRWEYAMPAIRVTLSSARHQARVYEDGRMFYLDGEDEVTEIFPRLSLASQAKRAMEKAILGYNIALDEGYEGKMRVKEEYHDPKKYIKEKDEEEFWGMVKKLQYHRSASNGSVA